MKETLEQELEYSQKLIDTIKKSSNLSDIPSIKSNINFLQEVIEDDKEILKLSKDKDAKVGHKSVEDGFFGYKSHLAMTEERIIVGVLLAEKNMMVKNYKL